MRFSWDWIHEYLERSLRTEYAEAEFAQVRLLDTRVAGFSSAPALLDHLQQRDHGIAETDPIYATLVRAVQSGRATRVAQQLLLCGLWPGLDGVYRRNVRGFRGREDDLSSALYAAFSELVPSLDLTRVTRVAATLVRSTAREAMLVLRSEWAKHEKYVEPLGTELDASAGAASADHENNELEHRYQRVESAAAAADPIALGVAYWRDLVDLRRSLLPVLGEDTDLMLRVAVLEEHHGSVASDLGIAAAAVRKRVQRARRRLSSHLRNPASLTRESNIEQD